MKHLVVVIFSIALIEGWILLPVSHSTLSFVLMALYVLGNIGSFILFLKFFGDRELFRRHGWLCAMGFGLLGTLIGCGGICYIAAYFIALMMGFASVEEKADSSYPASSPRNPCQPGSLGDMKY